MTIRSELDHRATAADEAAWLANGAEPGSLYAPALDRAHAIALAYAGSLRSRPVSRRLEPGEMAALLDEPLPEGGCAPEAAVEEWFRRAEPGIVASSGPRFFGYVIGGALPAALAGDWLASVIDQDTGLWLASPAASQTELVVLRWLKELFDLPASWSGTMTSGATMANLVGLAAGRQWVAGRMGFDAAADGLGGRPPLPVFASTHIHASAVKALGTLGIGRALVRRLPAIDGALDCAALERALSEIAAPVIVVANAGEVNTGAFDDLSRVADLCAAHRPGAWLHIDAAFGLFARLSPERRHLLDGVERADSLAADAHKWLNVPYDSGFAFVRDREVHRAAFAATAAYLTADPGAPDLDNFVPEMSRRFRGLPVWAALKSAGRAGYRTIVARCLANAAALGRWVDGHPDFELLAPVRLNVVCFRSAPVGVASDRLDELNRSAVSAIQRDGRAFVTGTVWDGQTAIRAAFDNWLTGPDDVRLLETALEEVTNRLRG